jgi:hypothetical protein
MPVDDKGERYALMLGHARDLLILRTYAALADTAFANLKKNGRYDEGAIYLETTDDLDMPALVRNYRVGHRNSNVLRPISYHASFAPVAQVVERLGTNASSAPLDNYYGDNGAVQAPLASLEERMQTTRVLNEDIWDFLYPDAPDGKDNSWDLDFVMSSDVEAALEAMYDGVPVLTEVGLMVLGLWV